MYVRACACVMFLYASLSILPCFAPLPVPSWNYKVSLSASHAASARIATHSRSRRSSRHPAWADCERQKERKIDRERERERNGGWCVAARRARRRRYETSRARRPSVGSLVARATSGAERSGAEIEQGPHRARRAPPVLFCTHVLPLARLHARTLARSLAHTLGSLARNNSKPEARWRPQRRRPRPRTSRSPRATRSS